MEKENEHEGGKNFIHYQYEKGGAKRQRSFILLAMMLYDTLGVGFHLLQPNEDMCKFSYFGNSQTLAKIEILLR